MRGNKVLFLLMFWFAVGGLTFTSCFIFHINSKLILVEIQEEEEGGCEDGKEDGDENSKTEQFFELATFDVGNLESACHLFMDIKKYDVKSGHYLLLIKPPLS